jgi:hypothetical protein
VEKDEGKWQRAEGSVDKKEEEEDEKKAWRSRGIEGWRVEKLKRVSKNCKEINNKGYQREKKEKQSKKIKTWNRIAEKEAI